MYRSLCTLMSKNLVIMTIFINWKKDTIRENTKQFFPFSFDLDIIKYCLFFVFITFFFRKMVQK